MTATNHAIMGALIATAVHNPWAALPLAFLSHFLLDVLPHFGPPEDMTVHTRKYWYIVGTDLVLAALLLTALLFSGHSQALLLTACAFAAASPDALWAYYLYYEVIAKKPKKLSKLAAFLGAIQWAEFPGGLGVEIVWGILTGVLLFSRVWA